MKREAKTQRPPKQFRMRLFQQRQPHQPQTLSSTAFRMKQSKPPYLSRHQRLPSTTFQTKQSQRRHPHQYQILPSRTFPPRIRQAKFLPQIRHNKTSKPLSKKPITSPTPATISPPLAHFPAQTAKKSSPPSTSRSERSIYRIGRSPHRRQATSSTRTLLLRE